MFKVNDYLNLLETEVDGVGEEFITSGINAGAMAVILALNSDLTYSKLKKLPNSVTWSMFNKAVTEKEYADGVLSAAIKYVEEFDTKRLAEGIKDMMAGKEFLVYVTSDEQEYGLGQAIGTPDVRKTLAGINDTEWGHMAKSRNFIKLLTCIKKINGELTTTLNAYDKLKEMPYLDYLRLSEIQIRLQDKLYNMDWKELLKN